MLKAETVHDNLVGWRLADRCQNIFDQRLQISEHVVADIGVGLHRNRD